MVEPTVKVAVFALSEVTRQIIEAKMPERSVGDPKPAPR